MYSTLRSILAIKLTFILFIAGLCGSYIPGYSARNMRIITPFSEGLLNPEKESVSLSLSEEFENRSAVDRHHSVIGPAKTEAGRPIHGRCSLSDLRLYIEL
jgi:hypothetical protein